jgi:hypothetical protein
MRMRTVAVLPPDLYESVPKHDKGERRQTSQEHEHGYDMSMRTSMANNA